MNITNKAILYRMQVVSSNSEHYVQRQCIFVFSNVKIRFSKLTKVVPYFRFCD